MQAIRKRVKPENGNIIIPIPDSMNGMDLDVIIIPVEGEGDSLEKHDPVQYRGALATGLSNDQIDDELARGRNEWENRTS